MLFVVCLFPLSYCFVQVFFLVFLVWQIVDNNSSELLLDTTKPKKKKFLGANYNGSDRGFELYFIYVCIMFPI